MKKALLFISMILILLLSCAPEKLQHQFKFDVPLPFGGVRVNEAFPMTIRQMSRVISKLELPHNMIGMRASYVKDEEEMIAMTIIQARAPEHALDYYLTVIKPELKKMQFSKESPENWENALYSEDKEGKQYLAWNNKVWTLELSGVDDSYFQTVVNACRFVELVKIDDENP